MNKTSTWIGVIAMVLGLGLGEARADGESVDWSQYIDKNPNPAPLTQVSKPTPKQATRTAAATPKPAKPAKAKPRARQKPRHR